MAVDDVRDRETGALQGMYSTVTGHEAKWNDDAGGWVVSWLPDEVLDTTRAEAALELSEWLCCGRVPERSDAAPVVEKSRSRLGLDLSIDELIELAGGRGPRRTGNRPTKKHPRVSAPPRAQAGPRPELAPVVAPSALGAPGSSGAGGGESGPQLTANQSTGAIRDAMVAAASELAGIVRAAEAARDELVSRQWAGMEEVAAACASLARPMEVLVTVGEKVGVAGAVIRAAYLAAPMVGEKSTVVESGETGVRVAPSTAGHRERASADGVVWPGGERTTGERAPAAAATPVEASAPAGELSVPPATNGAGKAAWQMVPGPLRRCTAPPDGHQRQDLCTSCEDVDDLDACSKKHDGDELDPEWHVWYVDLDGNPVRGGEGEMESFDNVTDLLIEAYSDFGPLVVRELATGELWTVEELRANYPEIVEKYELYY